MRRRSSPSTGYVASESWPSSSRAAANVRTSAGSRSMPAPSRRQGRRGHGVAGQELLERGQRGQRGGRVRDVVHAEHVAAGRAVQRIADLLDAADRRSADSLLAKTLHLLDGVEAARDLGGIRQQRQLLGGAAAGRRARMPGQAGRDEGPVEGQQGTLGELGGIHPHRVEPAWRAVNRPVRACAQGGRCLRRPCVDEA